MNNIDLILERSNVDDKDYIKSLYQYYLHDLSEFNESLQLNSTGSFDNSFIDLYYCDDHLIPLKITLGSSIIGFILCSISSGQVVDHVIQDTFILRSHRNKVFCVLALKQLFDLYPGKFGLDILIKNEPAKLFWRNLLDRLGRNYTSHEVIETGDLCIRMIFDSRK